MINPEPIALPTKEDFLAADRVLEFYLMRHNIVGADGRVGLVRWDMEQEMQEFYPLPDEED